MIRFDVNYYDDDEKNLFQISKIKEEVEKLVKEGLEVEPYDLLAESMFMEQKNQPNWKNRQDLEKRVLSRFDEFSEYFDLDGKTLVARFSPQDMENHRIERAAVGATLCAMGKILGTTAADWEKIPIGNKKDLDFQVASTGEDFLVLESKGSVVQDVTKKEGSISSHKLDIKDKKREQRHNRLSDTLVGGILAIPRDDKNLARIWLVDPPISMPFMSARRFKVISRYRFYERLIRLIGRPSLLVAFNTRIYALENIEDIAVLNGLALVDINGFPFGIPKSFLNARSRTLDKLIVGIVRPGTRRLMFVGMDTGVINVIVQQSHEAIMSWTSGLAGRRRVEIIINPKDLEGTEYATSYSEWSAVNFDITVNSSGLVLGVADQQDNTL